ncbi:FkbM family methyltransferase [Caballeronia humi]|uniref:Methyltransferase FkbM domain-containing protein n=1 Tax=Caballeronia humi TaxID=326474 RepID=A0A158GYV7_9BURK|nr:FkbM family methyltransferase [Caballeronia humi]SAL37354.1 hypothetical protein AWB65_02736 [Caballeronia humi]
MFETKVGFASEMADEGRKSEALGWNGVSKPSNENPHDETLIFDIGVNAGEDTSFYLEKGFRVVGVEANPRIFAQLQVTFAAAIADDSLTLLNIGIWKEASTLPFYVNLDNDHWSSFDPAYGCRDNTRHEIINVPCFTIESLVKKFGVPRYLKVDIEGGDKLVLADLAKIRHLPPFISVEEFGNHTLPELFKAGYRQFKIVPQRTKEQSTSGETQKEGFHVERVFTGKDSGVFGLDLAGDWLNYDQALLRFRQCVRTADGKSAGPADEWFDVHAALGESSMTPPSSIRWLWTLARKLRAKLEQQTQTTERHLLDADHRVQHAEQAHEATKRALEDERRLRIDAEHALETAQRICTDEQYLRTQAEEQSAVLRQKLLAANTHIADQGAQLRTVQSDLATIRSSRTWRLFAPYRRVRARFSAR